jgi:hypothetical protein
MAFREVSVVEVREVLRAWLSGVGLRTVGERAGVDRKTARYADVLSGVCAGDLGVAAGRTVAEISARAAATEKVRGPPAT